MVSLVNNMFECLQTFDIAQSVAYNRNDYYAGGSNLG